jgi:outer membrane biosynthesis protein TonB
LSPKAFFEPTAPPAAVPTESAASAEAATAVPAPVRAARSGGTDYPREVRPGRGGERASEPAAERIAPTSRRPVQPAQTQSEAAIEISPDVAREFGNRSVGLSVVIGEDGNVREARVISPLCPECDRAARAAILRYRFKPARDAQGRPVESRVAVPVIIPAPE